MCTFMHMLKYLRKNFEKTAVAVAFKHTKEHANGLQSGKSTETESHAASSVHLRQSSFMST